MGKKGEWTFRDTHEWICEQFPMVDGMAVARFVDMLIGFPVAVAGADDVFLWINSERTRRQLAAETARRRAEKEQPSEAGVPLGAVGMWAGRGEAADV